MDEKNEYYEGTNKNGYVHWKNSTQSDKCPDCGYAPGERSQAGDAEDDGCDQIANPLLKGDPGPGKCWTDPYKNPYAGKFFVSGEVNNTTPEDLNWVSNEKRCELPEGVGLPPGGDCCSEDYYSMNSNKSHYKKVRSPRVYNYVGEEDEMTAEAKKWMTKYSDLKVKFDKQTEFMIIYVDELRREMNESIDDMMHDILGIVSEKVVELEKKIENKN